MRQKIIELFAYNHSLKFSEIQSKLDIRSNKLAYWLAKLVTQNVLMKVKNCYVLTEKIEPLVPYLGAQLATLPVVLVHLGDTTNAFLIQRKKRPYYQMFGLPGGRLLIGESPEEAARRIMRTKHTMEISKPELKTIALEHVKEGRKVVHSFLLLLVTAKPRQQLRYTNIKKKKRNIIVSDYTLLTRQRAKPMFQTLITPHA